MAIELDGTRVTTTMRTPGNDFELAAGFCHAEGLLDGHPVLQVKYCANGSAVATAWNVVSVDTGGLAPEPVPRLTTTTFDLMRDNPGTGRAEALRRAMLDYLGDNSDQIPGVVGVELEIVDHKLGKPASAPIG